VKPTDLLTSEHRLIERMIALLADALHALEDIGTPKTSETDKANENLVEAGVDFFESYADRTHHGKEEDILFRELANKPLYEAEQQMMQQLMQEHVWTRQSVGRLASANARYRRGDAAALHTMLYETRRLVQSYPAHIEKEELHFFSPAMEYLSNAEQQAMLRRFTEFDSRLIHAHYIRVIEEQERTHRVPTGSFRH
jgi:hemerythrin-like domain-containing protein